MNHRHLAAGAWLIFASAPALAAPAERSERGALNGPSFAAVSGDTPGAPSADRPGHGQPIDIDWGAVPALALHADDAVLPRHFSIIDNGSTRGHAMHPFPPGLQGSPHWHAHAQPVPEPGTVALWLAGLGVVCFLGVRRRLGT